MLRFCQIYVWHIYYITGLIPLLQSLISHLKKLRKTGRFAYCQPCALHGHSSCPVLHIHSYTFGISYFTLARSISFHFSYRKDILGTQFLRFFPLRMFLFRLFHQIYNLSYIFSFEIKVFQNNLLFLVRSQSLLISFHSPVSNRHFPPDLPF